MNHGTRIGILGGTFDPVHLGHVETAHVAARALDLDRVLFLPSGAPPHRHQPVASRFHRFAMTALAVNGQDRLAVSDLEIGEVGPSYTFETLMRLHATGIDASQIFFITGADAFAEIETWSRYPQVLDLSHFVVVARPRHPSAALASSLPALAGRMRTVTPGRPAAAPSAATLHGDLGVFLVEARTPDVSSTEIRRRLETADSIAGLVPAAVHTYIFQHGLYARPDAVDDPADHLHGTHGKHDQN
jgi:nicotinate-nucleotide adenylyltransferase